MLSFIQAAYLINLLNTRILSSDVLGKKTFCYIVNVKKMLRHTWIL
jgi:hypothetical protein